MKNIKLYLLTTSIGIFGFNGCTPAMNQQLNPTVAQVQNSTKTTSNTIKSTLSAYEAPTETKLDHYANTMQKVASEIKNDTEYRRIALDTPQKKEWFKTLTYRLWDRQITRQQFLSQGLAKYPSHQHEFEFIIDGFAKTCH
jgi:hypothetical protein